MIENKTQQVLIRLDPELKEQATQILEDLGLSMSGAIRLFLKKVVETNSIPFDVYKSNKETT